MQVKIRILITIDFYKNIEKFVDRVQKNNKINRCSVQNEQNELKKKYLSDTSRILTTIFKFSK